MATTYHWHKQGYAIPYDAFGMVLLKKHFDVPALIASGAAGYSPLAVADVRAALPSTGFADGDSINMFRVPAGFLYLGGGCKVTTAGTTTCTMDVGYLTGTQTARGVASGDHGANTANDDAYLAIGAVSGTGSFNFDGSTGTEWVQNTDKLPVTDLYVTDGSIDVLFENAAQVLLIADFWVYGYKAY